MATATEVQLTRLYGPNPVLKEPLGPHCVRGFRADGLLRWSLIGKLWEETQGPRLA